MSDLRVRVEALTKLRDAATPGPWNMSETRYQWDQIIRSQKRDPLAAVLIAGWNRNIARSNATLMAAAPNAVALCEEIWARLQKAEAVIDSVITEDESFTADSDGCVALHGKPCPGCAARYYRAAYPKALEAKGKRDD